MKLTGYGLLMATAMTCSAPVWAADWRLIDDSGGAFIYIDADTVKADGDLVEFSQKQSFSTPQSSKSGQTYDYLIMGIAANCTDQTLAMTRGAAYKNDGTLIDSTTVPKARWAFTHPDLSTTGQAELKFVCSRVQEKH